MYSICFILLVLLLGGSASQPDMEKPQNATVVEGADNEQSPLPIYLYYDYNIFRLNVGYKVTWFEAFADCAKMGYTLASITNGTIQREINVMIASSRFRTILREPIWTSGSNLAYGNLWNWYSNGEPMIYHQFPGTPTPDERCLGYDPARLSWVPEICTEERYFLCQKRCSG